MSSPAQILKKLFLDRAVLEEHTGTDWPCFVQSMPDEPDQCACVLDTGSEKQGRLHLTGEVIEKPSCQIQFRSATYVAGWNKADEVRALVDTVLRETVVIGSESYLVQAIRRTQSVLPLGAEPGTKKRRELFTLNVYLSFRSTT